MASYTFASTFSSQWAIAPAGSAKGRPRLRQTPLQHLSQHFARVSSVVNLSFIPMGFLSCGIKKYWFLQKQLQWLFYVKSHELRSCGDSLCRSSEHISVLILCHSPPAFPLPATEYLHKSIRGIFVKRLIWAACEFPFSISSHTPFRGRSSLYLWRPSTRGILLAGQASMYRTKGFVLTLLLLFFLYQIYFSRFYFSPIRGFCAFTKLALPLSVPFPHWVVCRGCTQYLVCLITILCTSVGLWVYLRNGNVGGFVFKIIYRHLQGTKSVHQNIVLPLCVSGIIVWCAYQRAGGDSPKLRPPCAC